MNTIPPVIYHAAIVCIAALIATVIRSSVSKYGTERLNYTLEFVVCVCLLAFLHRLVFFGYEAEVTEYGKELLRKWKGREDELVFYMRLTGFVFFCFLLTFPLNRIYIALFKSDEWHKVAKEDRESPWAPR